MKTEIYVVSHKKTKMPKDSIYKPIQVGFDKENFKGYLRDNSLDNIADKNLNYSELTAQYWVYKNRHSDVKGLVHYRRLFSNGKSNFFSSISKKEKDVLNKQTLSKIMQKYDLILPKKRNYYIETTWQQYAHAHHEKDLITTRNVIKDKFPEYLPSFDKWMQKKVSHKFNMLIAKENIFNDYSKWLFDVLSEVERKTDISGYTAYEQRIYGFLSELLLDVWVEKNKIKYKELPVMFMGNQHWVRKISSFLIRKVRGTKIGK